MPERRMPRISTTKTLSAVPGDLQVGDINDFLAGCDDSDSVRITVNHGDRPGELGQVTLTVTKGEGA